MNRLDNYNEFSRNNIFSPIESTKNETRTKGLIVLGVLLFGITTIAGWYLISGPEHFPISYMITNFFLWTTSLVIILFGFNNRNN